MNYKLLVRTLVINAVIDEVSHLSEKFISFDARMKADEAFDIIKKIKPLSLGKTVTVTTVIKLYKEI